MIYFCKFCLYLRETVERQGDTRKEWLQWNLKPCNYSVCVCVITTASLVRKLDFFSTKMW